MSLISTDGAISPVVQLTKTHARSVYHLLRSSRQQARTVRSIAVRSSRVSEYLRSHSVRKLQIGAYKNPLPGWLNTDICILKPSVVYMDATKPFPLPSSSFDYVYSEHVIEHLPYQDGMFMLQECLRILRPGGRVRMATPSLNAMLRMFRSDDDDTKNYIDYMSNLWLSDVPLQTTCHLINNTFRNWGHQFIYDEATLCESMRLAGFVDVRAYTYGVSDAAALRNLETHGRGDGEAGRAASRYETMAVEGACP
jgi:predicted SAM-dependent methyltransferase